jgi:hypothetical protein
MSEPAGPSFFAMQASAQITTSAKIPIVFSLFGRPRELEICLESLRQCENLDRFIVHFDLNEDMNPANEAVFQIIEKYKGEYPQTMITLYNDGHGPDRNNLRTLRRFREKIIYFAGDVLLHPQALAKYLELNAQYPDNPLSLYHSKYHRLVYRGPDRAELPDYAFETLFFNPSPLLEDPIFGLWFNGRITCLDWMISWLLHKKGIKIYSTRLSYVQHLGVAGGNTNLIRPAYAYDYADQPAFLAALKRLGVDENLVNLMKK